MPYSSVRYRRGRSFDAPEKKSSDASSKPSDFEIRPLQVVWEVTRACDLDCVHCRSAVHPFRHPLELSTQQAFHLINEVAGIQAPNFVLTGGDPLKRPDLLDIVHYASLRSVKTSLNPSATPLLTREMIQLLARAGLMRLGMGLDGSTAQLHDSFRGVAGSYQRTLDAITWCHEAGIPVQVNTTVTRRNEADLDKMVELLKNLNAVVWCVFFLVPTGRGQAGDLLSPEEHEGVFAKLYAASQNVRFHIRTIEGQHYRRYVLQQKAKGSKLDMQGLVGSTPNGITEGKGLIFINHTGEVFPSAFLPCSAGNVTRQPLAEIYRNSPLFGSLRDSAQLKGKCRTCDFCDVCGGSRARAFAFIHDPLAEDPCCAYNPPTK